VQFNICNESMRVIYLKVKRMIFGNAKNKLISNACWDSAIFKHDFNFKLYCDTWGGFLVLHKGTQALITLS